MAYRAGGTGPDHPSARSSFELTPTSQARGDRAAWHNGDVIKLAVAGVLALVVAGGLFVYWSTPTTELVDASGAELTAGLPVLAAEPDASSETDDATSEVAVETGLFAGADFDESERLMEAGDHRSAKQHLALLLETSERDGEACILLSEACRALEEIDEAVDYGIKAVELLPEVGRAHYAYSKALGAKMVKGDGGLAAMVLLPKWKSALATSIELDPGNVDARVEQITFFTYMPAMIGGDTDRAVELCTELEEYDPARGKLWLARAYQKREELDRAIQLCEEGMEAFPENGMFANTLGGIRAGQERFEEADAAFETAKRAGRGEAYYRALVDQASMHVDHELDRKKAIALLDEFLEQDRSDPSTPMMPPKAMVLFKRGQALDQLGESDDARTAYEACLELEPRYTSAKDALDELGPSDG